MSVPPSHRTGWRIIATDDNTSKQAEVLREESDLPRIVVTSWGCGLCVGEEGPSKSGTNH